MLNVTDLSKTIGVKQVVFSLVLTWLGEHQYESKEYALGGWLTTWQLSDVSCAANDATLASAATVAEDSFLRDAFVRG